LLRNLCVEERGWLNAHEFEDAISATNLLPGPASTQLAILCAWRLRGRLGGLIGGVCFIIPGLVIILALSALFLAAHPPLWVLGAAAGAGAAVPAVALNAAIGLVPASWRSTGDAHALKVRWLCYFLAGGVSAATIGPYLVLVLFGCGLISAQRRQVLRSLGRVAAGGADGGTPRGQQRDQLLEVVPQRVDDDRALGVGGHLDRFPGLPAGLGQPPSASRPCSSSRASAPSSCSSDQARVRM
jgi:chromate transport protein ChrA